ncbi:MAG: SAM-dependent methyltransferase [Selenomonadaceae bacterium]|nr:SAM-dependent methyltransferase [Selenomonadaceae bacterium]
MNNNNTNNIYNSNKGKNNKGGSDGISMKVIARIRNDFPTKFGLPRQSGLVPELVSTIVFEPEFRVAEALRGIESYSHLWLIWEFHQAIREADN